MEQVSLIALARGSAADFTRLKGEIDRAAGAGHSYELANCLLLPGCFPPTATVGFWTDRGGYLLYINPSVAYGGKNLSGRRLFQTGRQGFGDFHDLAAFLRGMAAAAPPEPNRPAAPSFSPQTMPPYRADLTEPEQVVLPKSRRVEVPPYRDLARDLGQVVLGQEAAVETVAFRLYTHVSKHCPARPLSLILHGPTGVGKSELAKHVAPVLNRYFGEEAYQFVWTELNTFTEPHSVYRLTGAPPGYVGYEDKPVFEAVNANERTVFMFDELEKAHPEVLKTFMSVLDEGRCAARKELAGHRRELDFRRCIFLFTTNADLSQSPLRGRLGFLPGEEVTAQPMAEDGAVALADRLFLADERGRQALAGQGCLREIAGRFGGFVAFTPLEDGAKVRIIAKQIAALAEEFGLTLTYISPAIVQAVINRTTGGDTFSVRSHTGVIEGYLTPFFASQAGQYEKTIPLRLEGDMEAKRLLPAIPAYRPSAVG